MESLTVKEVAAELKIGYTTVLRLMDTAGLPFIRLGLGKRNRRIVRRQDLDAWLESRLEVKELT